MASSAILKPYSLEELLALVGEMPEVRKIDVRNKMRAMDLVAKEYVNKVGTTDLKKFQPYKFRPAEYIATFLKWTAWVSLHDDLPGQLDILNACALAMQKQEEKDLFEKGELTREELKVYKPGEKIKNWIRVESGNGVGKTKSSSGILNWFLDCFVPSAIFTFAPGGDQARFAMWAEIRKDRDGKGLPGRLLETEIKISGHHFAAHRTVSDGLGKGEERIKGKHEAFQLFIIDEADGVPDFVFDSITSMTSGGNSLVVMFANPKSRASMFHRIKSKSYVETFRISTLNHPNVVKGYEDIPGAVKRDFVETKIENDCDILHICEEGCELDHKELHNDEEFTFQLRYPVKIGEVDCPPGSIFRPNPRFMTDILGITPPNSADNTVVPVGVYEKSKERVAQGGDPTIAYVGLDAARFGGDMGKMYIRWQDAAWMACEFFKQKSEKYVEIIRENCLKLKGKGVKKLYIRVDAGYGNAIIDALAIDDELVRGFEEFEVYEVHFNGKAYSIEYYDLVTEMYFEAAETLKGIALIGTPPTLEIDLCEREYYYRNVQGKTKKKLEEKDDFKKRKKHSPDDGDGLVMALAPDYCFNKLTVSVISTSSVAQTPAVNKTTAMEDLLRLLNKKKG